MKIDSPGKIKTIRSSPKPLVADLRRLGAFRGVRRMLREHDVKGTRGWEGLDDRLAELEATDLEELYLDIRLTSSKAIGVTHVTSKQKNTLAAVAADARTVSALELLSSNLKMKDLADQPRLLGKVVIAGGTGLVFVSRRSYSTRHELSAEMLREDAPEEVKASKRIYAEQEGAFLACDVVWLPREASTIQLRIDTSMPGLERSVAEHGSEIESEVDRRLLGGRAKQMKPPVDFFPAIQNIYDDPDFGKISELHFDCSTGCRRVEKMRNGQDVRQELYHRKGVEEIEAITPYRASVVLEHGTAEYVVVLPGSPMMLKHSNRPLNYLHVDGFPSSGTAAW